MAIRCCSGRTLLLLLLVSAVPISLVIQLERATWASPALHFHYRSLGWVRECAKWDAPAGRFLVSTGLDGGLAEVSVARSDGVLAERTLLREPDAAGNASLGLAVDRHRGRVLVVFADVGSRFGAVGAYRLDNFQRLFLARLSGPEDGPSFADDVAVDADGNAYVTDFKGSKIWKVGLNGELLAVIRSPAFVQRKEWYYNLGGLNGIVYHPNGFLLVIHTGSGHLFKVDTSTHEVSVVEVEGSLLMGDGLELVSPTKIVVAAIRPSARLVESSDDWKTARVTETYSGPSHRVATSATVKDGKVYISHLLGGGLKTRTHVISEAVFSPLSPK